MNKIQITYQESYFNVILSGNEVLGRALTSFYDAYDLAKEYKRSNKELEIIVPEEISELIDVYYELRVFAEKMDLPTDIFQGLADKILQYNEEHKDKSRSFDSFMAWLQVANKNVH